MFEFFDLRQQKDMRNQCVKLERIKAMDLFVSKDKKMAPCWLRQIKTKQDETFFLRVFSRKSDFS